jgi:class 3 adenylate cyclase
MPNLKHLANLKEKYPQFNKKLTSKETRYIIEAFDPSKIEKGFSFDDGSVQEYIEFFRERKKVEVVLLFIDITSFSQKFQNKTSDQIAEYLDKYYSEVIPIINFCGGEVEKIIGDGIIAVFGEPFLKGDREALHKKAEECASVIVASNKNTEFESKVALHFGEVLYYNNEDIDYSDFTIVGKALTELFRLESVSDPNAINFYSGTYFERKNLDDVNRSRANSGAGKAKWFLSVVKETNLKGVDFVGFRSLKYEP